MDLSKLPLRIQVGVDDADLTTSEAKTEFDLALRVIGPDGQLAAPSIHRLSLAITAEGKEQALKEGIATDLQIPAGVPGFYRISVAVRNQRTGEIGSTNSFIEVPKASRPTNPRQPLGELTRSVHFRFTFRNQSRQRLTSQQSL